MTDGKKGVLALLLSKNKGESAEQEPKTGSEMEPEMESGESPGGDDMGLDAAAQELLDAVESKDVEGVKSALRNAFSILESQPHEEGDHTNE